jgi:hypothetical protein
MVSGAAAALLACQMASKAYEDCQREEPSYTTRSRMPHSSPTACVGTCETSAPVAGLSSFCYDWCCTASNEIYKKLGA